MLANQPASQSHRSPGHIPVQLRTLATLPGNAALAPEITATEAVNEHESPADPAVDVHNISVHRMHLIQAPRTLPDSRFKRSQ